MASIRDWSGTAGSNTSVGGVSIAENMAPSGVNNGMRAIMADVANWRALLEGAKATTGSSNTYAVTSGLSMASYAEPLAFIATANHTNTGAATMAVDGLTAKDIKRVDGSALSAGDITSGGQYLFAYEAAADDFFLLTPTPTTITASSTTTLTNKTIDGDDNTLSDIAYSSIKSTSRTGSDVKLVTGTAGTANDGLIWNADGDAVGGGNAATQTLTNKTLTSPTISAAAASGTWTTPSSWTLPAITLGGAVSAADQVIGRPVIKDYGETVNAMGSISGSQTINIESGNVVTATASGAITWTFSNPSASGTACSFTLILTNGGAGSQSWPAAVDWPGGTAPDLQTSGVDIIAFMTINAGSTWYGFPGGLDMG